MDKQPLPVVTGIITVAVTLRLDPEVSFDEVIQEMDYDFTSNTDGAEFTNMTVTNAELGNEEVSLDYVASLLYGVDNNQ